MAYFVIIPLNGRPINPKMIIYPQIIVLLEKIFGIIRATQDNTSANTIMKGFGIYIILRPATPS